MNFLGIGPFELLLILVIAIIVLGPERMAETGRTLGRLYAQYRRRWQKDVDEMTRELRRELAMLQHELEDIRQTTEDEIKTAQAAWDSAVDIREPQTVASVASAEAEAPSAEAEAPSAEAEAPSATVESSAEPSNDEPPAQAQGATTTETEHCRPGQASRTTRQKDEQPR